jgi:hypothetical protein
MGGAAGRLSVEWPARRTRCGRWRTTHERGDSPGVLIAVVPQGATGVRQAGCGAEEPGTARGGTPGAQTGLG